MKQKTIVAILTVIILGYMSNTAYANSSWHWITNKPYTILPWMIVVTVFFEFFAVYRINYISKPMKTFVVIAITNAISFLTPYIFIGLSPVIYAKELGFFKSIHSFVEKFPFYIVGTTFLFLTLIVEIPIVYFLLRNNVRKSRRLFISIFVVNSITTLMIAMIERILCKGSW